jgi:hypothetical protein
MRPEELGLLASFNPANHLLLHQELVADVAQQLLSVSVGALLLSQGRGERFDAVEVLGDPGLVVREHQALGEDVGNQLQSLDGLLFAQKDVAGDINMLVTTATPPSGTSTARGATPSGSLRSPRIQPFAQ